jgi:hypothetical protein
MVAAGWVTRAVAWRAGAHAEPSGNLAHLDAMGLSKYDMPEYMPKVDHVPLMPCGKMRKRDIVDWISEGRAVPEPVRTATGKSARSG